MSHVDPISWDQSQKVYDRGVRADELGRKISRALELIERELDDLGEQCIAISFNGGKDCTVLLHLLAAVLSSRHGTSSNHNQHLHNHTEKRSTDTTSDISLTQASSSLAKQPNGLNRAENDHYESTQPFAPATSPSTATETPLGRATHYLSASSSKLPYPPIRSIYITAPNPFPALDTFVLDSATRYGLDLYRFGGGMKAALSEYLGCNGGKGVKGVLVGTRHGDPNGDVQPLALTDASWPTLLRIHPILDWTYSDVWTFLRELDVSWCSLYDKGYTSLGSTTNTIPNPLLKRPDGGWNPAWMLTDETQERAGRIDSS